MSAEKAVVRRDRMMSKLLRSAESPHEQESRSLLCERPVLFGAFAGTAACGAVSRVLAGILFRVNPHDAVTFTGVPAALCRDCTACRLDSRAAGHAR